MSTGDFTVDEVRSVREALNEVMEAMPKKKSLDFIGHFNDVFCFLNSAERYLIKKGKK